MAIARWLESSNLSLSASISSLIYVISIKPVNVRMDIQKSWQKALQQTEIVRSRIQTLKTFADTDLPYIFLCESEVNHGDTMVRRGQVAVTRPSLILPPNIPQFEGFDISEKNFFGDDDILRFLLLRGVTLPSLHYNNLTQTLDVYEGRLTQAVKHFENELQRQEDVYTGLLTGPPDCWPLSLLIFVCSQVQRNAETDIRKLLEEYRKKNLPNA